MPELFRDLQFNVRRTRARCGCSMSHFDEAAIIDRLVVKLGITNRTAVDIGAGDGIRSSNTYGLFRSGWRGIGIEADAIKARRLTRAYAEFEDVTAVKFTVQPDNVAKLLRGYGIEQRHGVLSIDIDGNDYWVLDAVLAEFRPQLVVSEYNEKIPPPFKFVTNYEPDFRLRHHFFGYSIAKLSDLLKHHAYVLVEVEFNNLFIAPVEIAAHVAITIEDGYAHGYRERADRAEKFPENVDIEALYSLRDAEAVAFLHDFFAEEEGEYTLEIPS